MKIPEFIKVLTKIETRFPGTHLGAVIPGDPKGMCAPYIVVTLQQQGKHILASILGVRSEDREATLEDIKKRSLEFIVVKGESRMDIN